MVVSQASWVDEQPALLGVGDAAVVANETATSAFIVNASPVESNVDGVGGRVVVRAQEGLLIWLVAHNEVHDGMRGIVEVACKDLLL